MVSRKTFQSALLYFQTFLGKVDRTKLDFTKLDLVICVCIRIAARMYECQCLSRVQTLQKKQVWLLDYIYIIIFLLVCNVLLL